PRNQYRRRRKHPRPQVQVPNPPVHNYQISETQESDTLISRKPDDHQLSEELPYNLKYEPNYQHQTERERRKQVQSLHSTSQQHDNSQSSEYQNNFTPKRPRVHKNKYVASQEPETEGEIDDSFIAEQAPSNSYQTPQQEEPVLSPQDLKALLKQQSGSLSLSEILQQRNLSLTDLLKGNRNALSALTSTQIQLSNTQQPSITRRLPSSRQKYHNKDGQRPQRYSGNQDHAPEESTTESVIHRRLPAIKTPTQWKQALGDNTKPLRFRDHDFVDVDTNERINKFVPSSPRRTTQHNSESSFIYSTESIEVTKSIISGHKENQNENEESDEENIKTSTKYNEVTPRTSQPPIRITEEDTVKQTTNDQTSQVPLDIQETPVIDPLNNVPEEENQAYGQKRLREKYLTRYSVSAAQNSSKDNVINRFRLPPINSFKKSRTTNVISSTEESKWFEETTTLKPHIEFHPSTEQLQKIEESKKTEVQQNKPLESEKTTISSEVELEETNSYNDNQEDDNGNIIFGKPDIRTPDRFNTQEKQSYAENGPMHKVIPIHIETSTIKVNIPIRTPSARDEILEFLKSEMGFTRLATILASRNMTLAELIDHRERGSSQQHLAEIFKESNPQPIQESESEEDKSNANHNEQNDIMYNILKNFQRTISTNSDDTNPQIPSIEEMFGILHDHHKSNHSDIKDIHTNTDNNEEEQHNSNKQSESHKEQFRKDKNILFDSLPTFPTQKPQISVQNPFNTHTTSSRKLHETPTIYSFQPMNHYLNPELRPIITSRLTSTPPTDDMEESINLLENIGQVRELGNKAKTNNYRGDEQKFDILFGNNIEDEITSNSGLPDDVKSAIIVSSAILGAAILGFLTIFVVCRWKQRRARRRFVDGIMNTKAKSPILIQSDGKNASCSLNPIMVNSTDLYKRDLTINCEAHMNPGMRKYYLWRTIRKTLRYK
ncbi:hypothetical protein L9F63_001402, partial [Diploptera punctata]